MSHFQLVRESFNKIRKYFHKPLIGVHVRPVENGILWMMRIDDEYTETTIAWDSISRMEVQALFLVARICIFTNNSDGTPGFFYSLNGDTPGFYPLSYALSEKFPDQIDNRDLFSRAMEEGPFVLYEKTKNVI